MRITPTNAERERFFAKVVVAESGCHEWTGSRISAGYGYFRYDGKTRRVHRVAWMWANGPIPDDLTVDHMCENRACVNLDHLQLLTRGANALRGGGPAAVNKRKETCVRGHSLSGLNLHIRQNGARVCKKCACILQTEYYRRRVLVKA